MVKHEKKQKTQDTALTTPKGGSRRAALTSPKDGSRRAALTTPKDGRRRAALTTPQGGRRRDEARKHFGKLDEEKAVVCCWQHHQFRQKRARPGLGGVGGQAQRRGVAECEKYLRQWPVAGHRKLELPAVPQPHR